ncbi:MAG: hypothetical protein A2W99_09195 [Bacteroidetes bacterium GWF2_33_16]|nr:MAG: hypothetical protein A2X00_07640 [Bacteroidetes bacterium GWE2_32_14]OFY03786.1 MAG: hypothetical protein A2W99_09195 [Bacteroidetes bacterium GWF2_33_16]
MYNLIETIVAISKIQPELLKHQESEIFTDLELKQNESKNKIKSLGARYLIKRSILDFLEQDNYHEIEILNDKQGKPEIFIKGKSKESMEIRAIKNTQISISHSKNYVATLVTIE